MSESKRPAPDENASGDAAVAAAGEEAKAGPQTAERNGQDGDIAMATEEHQQASNHDNQPRRPGSIARKGWPPYRPKPDHLRKFGLWDALSFNFGCTLPSRLVVITLVYYSLTR